MYTSSWEKEEEGAQSFLSDKAKETRTHMWESVKCTRRKSDVFAGEMSDIDECDVVFVEVFLAGSLLLPPPAIMGGRLIKQVYPLRFLLVNRAPLYQFRVL